MTNCQGKRFLKSDGLVSSSVVSEFRGFQFRGYCSDPLPRVGRKYDVGLVFSYGKEVWRRVTCKSNKFQKIKSGKKLKSGLFLNIFLKKKIFFISNFAKIAVVN